MGKRLFKGKSIRLRGFDYKSPGIYHVVFCCHNRFQRFGIVSKSKMELNTFGCIVNEEFKAIDEHFEFCFTHAYQIMPNHVHWLLEIRAVPNATHHVPLGDIIARFKACVFGKCLQYCKVNNIKLGKFWQTGFYDSIITSEQMYKNTIMYIYDNPSQWQTDRFYPESRSASNV